MTTFGSASFGRGRAATRAWAFAQRAERLATDAEDDFERGGDPSVSVARYTEADSLLALAEAIDPDWVHLPAARAQAAYRRAWFSGTMGDLEFARNEVDVGIEHANRALAFDPRDGDALEQRGDAEAAGGSDGERPGSRATRWSSKA